MVVIAGFIIGKNLITNNKEEYTLQKVERTSIVQEVSETGTVKMGEEIKLNFKRAGAIEGTYISIGQKVTSGQSLAKLDTRELAIQLTEAQAQQEVAQASLNKLLAGATPEEIQVKETTVANASVSWENAKQNLINVQAETENDLNSVHEDAVNTIEAAYLEVENSANLAGRIQRDYFSSGDQESMQVINAKNKINLASAQAKNWLDSVNNLIFGEAEDNYKKVDEALTGLKNELKTTSDNLIIIRQNCDKPNYWNTVSSTDKDAIDSQRTAVNVDLTAVVNSEQAISSTKITNQTSINTVQASVDTAQGNLKKAEDDLLLLKAGPRSEDVDLYQAQLKQAEAKISLLQRQISDSYLVSPVIGQITKIEKRVGETVQPTISDYVVAILPDTPFQIEVNIYEEDVVKMAIGNPVEIGLVAFPDQSFTGKVISIEPAEKVIEEVVYYKTIIDFDEIPQGVRPGMTADITIKTAFRENVLAVPKRAIKKADGRTTIDIFKNGNIEKREIQTGIEGSEGMVEVVSGIEEGEEIVIR